MPAHQTSPTRLTRRYAIARIAAIVTGLLGLALALLTPLMPVTQTTAQLSWPQNGTIRSVEAPLVSYVPVSMDVSVPCQAINQLAPANTRPTTSPDGVNTTANDSVLLSTLPKQAEKSLSRGLFIRKSGAPNAPPQNQTIEVVVRNNSIVSATVAQINAQRCQSIDIRSDADGTTAEFVGMTGDDGKPLQGDDDGDNRPQMTGIFTDLSGSAASMPGLKVSASIDDRYSTHATVLKWLVIAFGVLCTLVSLAALAVLDSSDGRRHRRLLPQRWWTFNPRDAVVIGSLVVWHIVGTNTSDDGYILTMSRIADHAGYTANYYRWYGAPEAPFGWYYSVFGWLGEFTTASPWIRLPALACGILVWLLISHEILPRLGRAALTNRAVAWTAAFTFLAAWLPFNNGLRPEPIICLGAVLTWCSVERAIATGRILPAATACLVAAFTVAAGPTGLMAVAALIAGGRPMVSALVKRAKVITPQGSSRRGRWASYLALLAPVAAAGTFVVFVVFSNLTLRSFSESTAMKTDLGPSLPWFNEISRYSALFAFSADGSIGRRFSVLLMFALLLLCGAMLLRKNRITGTSLGPTRRVVGITFASLVFLMFTPTKWTHQLGVFAGFAAALGAIAAIAIGASAMSSRRNRTLVGALLLLVTAFAFTAPNSAYYYSAWGVPWANKTVELGPFKVGSVFLYLAVLALIVAGWQHFRAPFDTADHRRPRRALHRAATTAPIAIIAAAVVLFEIVTSTMAGVNQGGSYSVVNSNLRALTGRACAMADNVLVEPDPNGSFLTPVNGTLADSLRGPITDADRARQATAPDDSTKDDVPVRGTVGFTPNGLPVTLDSKASQASLGVLGGNATTSPDILNSNTGDNGGGELTHPGVNGSTAKLPFGLDPSRVPILGSYSTTDQQPSYITSAWFTLPAKSDDHPLITFSAAGRFMSETLQVQYTTSKSKDPNTFTVAGAHQVIDPGPSPSWRNLRIDRSSLPDATAIRIVGKDENLDPESFMAITPPRLPKLITLQEMVGNDDPAQIDWTSGLAFPCQRPFNIANGIAEVPKWRIMPGSDLSAAVTAWQNSFGGGPLGWIEVALDTTTVPSYLENDIGRDWGSLVRYTPYGDPVLAELELGRATRSGLWSPAPIRS